jgi:hypothetical protein
MQRTNGNALRHRDEPGSSFTMEDLEGRRLMNGGTFSFSQLTAAALAQAVLTRAAQIAGSGPNVTPNQVGFAAVNGLNDAMSRGGMSHIGNMNMLQANSYVLNNLPQSAYYRDPLTGFNLVTDMGPGFTAPVYASVSNNIARNFSRGAGYVDYTGVMNRYDLVNVPGAGFAGQNAYLSLGVAQHGTSFLARHPDGSQAYASDFGLPYSGGVFTGSAINYNNVFNNAWNSRW